MVKRQPDGKLLWGVLVETEAYSQEDPACHGYRRRSPSNATLFGEPGRLYIYLSYGIHHCVNVVTGRADWANGVLLRAVAMPGEPQRQQADPGRSAPCAGVVEHQRGVKAAFTCKSRLRLRIWMFVLGPCQLLRQLHSLTPWRLCSCQLISASARSNLRPSVPPIQRRFLSSMPLGT